MILSAVKNVKNWPTDILRTVESVLEKVRKGHSDSTLIDLQDSQFLRCGGKCFGTQYLGDLGNKKGKAKFSTFPFLNAFGLG